MPLEKIIKHGDEEFQGKKEDDPTMAGYWLENSQRVFEEFQCSDENKLRCVVSLLKYEAYQWWTTVKNVNLIERITWNFFSLEFKNKFVG